jgi:hypothetical protein
VRQTLAGGSHWLGCFPQLHRKNEKQAPFDQAQGRLSTSLRVAQNDSQDGATGFENPLIAMMPQ